jgi:undecaprenyl-diphosphatase
LIRRLLDSDAHFSSQLRVAEKPSPLRTLAIFLAHSGDSWFWGLGLLIVWLLGTPASKSIAVKLVIGIAVTAVMVQTIKLLVRRQRPEGEWGTIYRRADPHSFPSGHAARMAMLVILGGALTSPAFTALLLLWAPLVALARVAMGVHYLSDILAGALLGITIGAALAYIF